MTTEEVKKGLEKEVTNVRIPNANSFVEKDECALSFDNPLTATGLYTNLKTWLSYGKEYVEQDSKRTGVNIYLYQKHYKVNLKISKLQKILFIHF